MENESACLPPSTTPLDGWRLLIPQSAPPFHHLSKKDVRPSALIFLSGAQIFLFAIEKIGLRSDRRSSVVNLGAAAVKRALNGQGSFFIILCQQVLGITLRTSVRPPFCRHFTYSHCWAQSLGPTVTVCIRKNPPMTPILKTAAGIGNQDPLF